MNDMISVTILYNDSKIEISNNLCVFRNEKQQNQEHITDESKSAPRKFMFTGFFQLFASSTPAPITMS
jgi:hypothetical protein